MHPGLSGGPVFDRDGALIGMVMATLNSEVYGVALPLSALLGVLEETRLHVREEEERLAAAARLPGRPRRRRHSLHRRALSRLNRVLVAQRPGHPGEGRWLIPR